MIVITQDLLRISINELNIEMQEKTKLMLIISIH